MTTKNAGYIQQLDEGEDTVDWKSPLKKISNWITRSRVMGELDFFSLDVKFLLRGEETFRTVFAGIVGMLLYLTTALLTYYIAWPPALTSRITERQLNKYS